MEMNFDPMTGEPIRKQEPQEEMNFDPMTGEPIRKQEPQEEMNFDPMTGRPLGAAGAGKKKKIWPFVAGAVGVAAAAAIIVVGGIRSGAFLSKPNKVLLATKNTLEMSEIAKAADFSDILKSEKYTVNATGSMSGVSVDVSLMQNGKKRGVKGNIDIIGGLDMEFAGVLDEEQLKVSLPFIDDDTLLVYNYRDENDGYLLENIGLDGDEINQAIQMVYSGKEQKKASKELTDKVLEAFRSLEFEKVDKEKFKVNEKKVSCKGYETTVTYDDIEDVLDDIEDVMDENLEAASKLPRYKELKGELKDELRNMEDIELQFFIYKNKLACIRMEFYGQEVELQFLGGARRTQNMLLSYNGKEMIELEGSTEGKEETSTLIIEGTEAAEMSFDLKSRDFEISVADVFYASGTIEAGRNDVSIQLDELKIEGEYLPLEGELHISSGAKIEDLEGDDLDLGNASEKEIMDYMERYKEILYSL